MKMIISRQGLLYQLLILYCLSMSFVLEAHADNPLDVGCLSGYQTWLRPTDSLEVSAMPAPIKIKMAGVKTFRGEIPHGCGGYIPDGTQVNIFTLNNKLYSLELSVKTSKPHFSQYISPKEISRMESSFRRNSYAMSELSSNLDKGISFAYLVELVPGGFLERLTYKSPESSKYE